MDRNDFVLAAMSAAGADEVSPVQVQKLFFLLDENISNLIDGKQFDFKPYHYGPFDAQVYRELDRLQADGRAYISAPNTVSSRRFRLSQSGIDEGQRLLSEMNPRAKDYIERAMKYVLSLGFRDLVASIYEAYPEMKANSVLASDDVGA
jgi:hypothetical protein